MNTEKKNILFVTTFYPPNNTGASVVMSNLIKELDQDTVYGVATWANSYKDKDETINGKIVHKLFNFQYLFNPRLWFFVRRFTFNTEKKKVIKLIKKEKITVVVGVYPDLDFLEIARSASEVCGVKFYAYLHDTLAEGLSHKRYKNMAKIVQQKVFDTSHKIFVMSEGMKDLYKEKYNVETIPLLHSFSEEEEEKEFNNNNIEKSIFWGGAIYAINKETVKRIHLACADLNYTLTLSAANTYEKLTTLGFENKNIKILPFLSRKDYITILGNQKALLLSIDWPDESTVHKDELGTIFPTKTIEYLISGRPILVHCPEEYFLAKFFKKHKCGIVLTDRNPQVIKEQIEAVFSDEKKLQEMIKNAYKASKQFHISNVKSIFESGLSD
ncbi:glycosyltransferase [Flavobacteriales bacterium]|nr:glycosyltransferase [Flavobacteriales bacterium]